MTCTNSHSRFNLTCIHNYFRSAPAIYENRFQIRRKFGHCISARQYTHISFLLRLSGATGAFHSPGEFSVDDSLLNYNTLTTIVIQSRCLQICQCSIILFLSFVFFLFPSILSLRYISVVVAIKLQFILFYFVFHTNISIFLESLTWCSCYEQGFLNPHFRYKRTVPSAYPCSMKHKYHIFSL